MISTTISRFPKQRPPLPDNIKKIYTSHYLINRQGKSPITSFSSKLEAWMHRQIAQSSDKNLSTLEIGAGTLNQLDFEPASKIYDIAEPFSQLYQHSPHIKKITHIFPDIHHIPRTIKYHRITSIAVFEHLEDLPQVIASTCLHLKPQGLLAVAIPNTGSLTWYLAWQCSTAIEYRIKYNLNYSLLMRHEHINTSAEIASLLRYFYHNVSLTYFGLTSYLSLYHVYLCTNPRLKRASRYQNQHPNSTA